MATDGEKLGEKIGDHNIIPCWRTTVPSRQQTNTVKVWMRFIACGNTHTPLTHYTT